MKKTKMQKGITLIALIITIVVLLIIAVVTIGSIKDSNIITYAQNATNDYTIAQEKELIGLGYSEYQIAKYANNPSELTVDGATVSGKETTGWKVTFDKSENEYTLSSTGEISNYKPITNPYDSDGWTYAYTCTGGIWDNTQLVNDGETAIPTNVDIVAKFYKVERAEGEEGITPDAFAIDDASINLPFEEGDEYKLVIEGEGNMGSLLDSSTMTGYAWNKDVATAIQSGDGSDLIIAYVTEVIICEGISNIGVYCFVPAMSLSKITMPNSSLISIDDYAFQGSGITNILIPSSVTTIGECAFQYCSNLSKVYIESTSSQFNVGREAFRGLAESAKIFVKDTAIETIIQNSDTSTTFTFSYDW